MVAFAFDMSNAGAPPGALPEDGGRFVSPPPPPQLATSATMRREAQSTKDRLCMLGSPRLGWLSVVKSNTSIYPISIDFISHKMHKKTQEALATSYVFCAFLWLILSGNGS